MITSKDLGTFKDNYSTIKKKLIDYENLFLEPTLTEKKRMESIIFDYIRQYKRKIYGGYALNKLIVNKNPDDGFYDLDNEFADIDFYSPEPIEDCVRIANIFFNRGFKHVSASEAQHEETYSVFVDTIKVCDVSWVPKAIYNRTPFIDINDVYYVAPQFIMIDMMRMITDPLTSGSQRWDKTVPRIALLQKHYSYPKTKSRVHSQTIKTVSEYVFHRNLDNADDSATFKYTFTKSDEDMIMSIIEYILTLMEDNPDFILYGDYAYNYYSIESGFKNVLKVVTLEAICLDFIIKTKELYNNIKQKYGDDISAIEYYPFWMLAGHSCSITYKGYPLITVTYYNKRCVPVKKYNKINISSLDYTILLLLIESLKARVCKYQPMMDYKSNQVSDILLFKSTYFQNNSSKNILDETPFQQFMIECVGKTIDARRGSFLKRKKKISEGKLIMWKYDPEKSYKENEESSFVFKNSSGNIIRPKSSKNYKIITQ